MSREVPGFLGTVRTGILEGLASGTSQDVPSSPSFSWDYVRTGILEGLTYGTCCDVLSGPRACWDRRTVHGNPGPLYFTMCLAIISSRLSRLINPQRACARGL